MVICCAAKDIAAATFRLLSASFFSVLMVVIDLGGGE